MRPKKHKTTGSNDLFRVRLDQIINMKQELVLLAVKIDWDWIDGEIAPLYSENGRPGIETRFTIGLLLLKHIYGLSDEGVCERWVHDPYFQFFTGEEFFQHAFPHERSDLSHWREDGHQREPGFAEFPNFPADRVRELSNSDLLHMLFGVAT
jgi:IS5 family transposase